MTTRADAVKHAAAILALWRGFDWQDNPDPRQQRRQDEFHRVAEKVVAQVEDDMGSFAWKPE